MTMTLLEFQKTEPPPAQSAPVSKFVETSELMAVFPWEDAVGTGQAYNQEASLPSTTARAVGETFTASMGTWNPGFEPLKIYGGKSQFDAFLIRSGRGARRAIETAAFNESVAMNWESDFFKGDTSSDPRPVQGLQNRLTDTSQNLFSNGTAAATIRNCKRAARLGRNITHIAMGDLMKIRFDTAAHNSSVGGSVLIREADNLGMPITFLLGFPIIEIKKDENDSDILDFSEASSTTSIYFLSLRPDRLHGIWHGPPSMVDLGRDPTSGTAYNSVLDWDAGTVMEHPRAAVRMSAITDAAITLE
ncbi:MAG: hypothetical protein O7A04_12335 [Acidobacteria bacterium]|nr:hypothetical protein [Acidobacteriota bacterium]